MENASYMESNVENLKNSDDNINSNISSNSEEEGHIPQLFSSEDELDSESNLEEFSNSNSEKLFDQEINDEEDFEIPAFLRKQKF